MYEAEVKYSEVYKFPCLQSRDLGSRLSPTPKRP